MSRQRVQRDLEADRLVRSAERLTAGRLFLTKDVDTPPELTALRIQEINQELRRIEIRLAELESGVLKSNAPFSRRAGPNSVAMPSQKS